MSNIVKMLIMKVLHRQSQMCYTIERATTFHFWIKMKYPKMDEQKHPFMNENRICTDSSKKSSICG